jgi:uridine phosphorylase
MNNSKKAKNHLQISSDSLPEIALLPGDPARVYEIGECLSNVKEIGNNRGYITITGTYKGLPLTVCSSGIGGPSTEIAVVELNRLGVDTIIRVGTSGGLADHVKPGDVIVLSSCIRYSGTANLFIPENFPAVADYRLLTALISACEEAGVVYHVGIGLSLDSFYATKPDLLRKDFPSSIYGKLEEWIAAGALQLDMEAATLYVLSSLLKINAAAICTAGSSISRGERPEIPPSNENAIIAACEAACKFNNWKEISIKRGRSFTLPPIAERGNEQ